MSIQNKEEPSTAPIPDRWYTLTLGSSFKDHQPSSKFCTLRYEFKPASIDKTQPGLLHKTKDNKISVEFQNNQPGKPKVTFEGSSEDYKENDAVLFFDGQTFRLERLHRAVKRLRHVREKAEATAGLGGGSGAEERSPPVGRGSRAPVPGQNLNARPGFNERQHVGPPAQPLPPPVVPVVPVAVEVERINVERIDIGGDAGSSGGRKPTRNEDPSTATPPPLAQPPPTATPPAATTPDSNDFDLDIMNDDDDDVDITADVDKAGAPPLHPGIGIDINLPHNDTDDDDEDDEEIADVDINDEIADVDINADVDEGGMMAHNAAEALRAQVNAREDDRTSSSSASSESESSSSSSGESSSSSGDSDSSDADSVNSI